MELFSRFPSETSVLFIFSSDSSGQEATSSSSTNVVRDSNFEKRSRLFCVSTISTLLLSSVSCSLININSNIAGLMGGIIPIAGIAGGILAGTIRRSNPLRMAAILVIIIGLLVMAIPFIPYLGLWFILIAVGLVATIVISLEYAIVALMDRDSRYMALNIGLINSIQIGIGSVVPAVFGFVEIYGFSYSWLFLGAFSISTLVFLLLLPRDVLRFYGR